MTSEIHAAITKAALGTLDAILFPRGSIQPEHGAIMLVGASTGQRRRTLLLREVLAPRPGEVVWDHYAGLLFSTGYKSRAVSAATQAQCGLAFIHTHPRTPSGAHPCPSEQDFRADARDLFFLGQELLNAPLVAAVVAPNGRWSIREYKFSLPSESADVGMKGYRWRDGRIGWATALRVVGERLEIRPCAHARRGVENSALDTQAQDSSIRLWGRDGQERLAGLRVGLTGLGGVGGILAEHLARLGVGELVMLDFDRLSVENLNRSQGATRSDACMRKKKVAVGGRNARAAATAPRFKATARDGSAVERETIPYMLDCDIILNGADSPWARQVLNHIAYAHMIPVINGGTELRGRDGVLVAGKSEVSAAGPGHPCFECSGVYDRPSVTEAMEHPSLRGQRGYLQDGTQEPVRAPSVISNNALVASLMELRLCAITLGTTPDAVFGTQRYDSLDGTLHWALTRACKAGCRQVSLTGLGDAHFLPTGTDLDRQVALEVEKK
ncbi:MAG TPA: ThiF family adenylyltransferase [Kofleriaceae bacterium]|jgi:hypothetical protein